MDTKEYLSLQEKEAESLTTIEAILAHQFVGNHFSDSAAFNTIESFLDSDASIEQKVQALRHMAVNGMGFDDVPDSEYIESINEQL